MEILKAKIYCIFGLLKVLFSPVDPLDFRSEPFFDVWIGEGRRTNHGDVLMEERKGDGRRMMIPTSGGEDF